MTVSTAPRITRAAESLPRRRFTVAEFEAMAAAGIIEAHERVELIGGELVVMAPKGERHDSLANALRRRWTSAAPDACDFAVAPAFRLSVDTCLAPDLLIFSRATGLQGLAAADALLVVEIADESVGFDLGRKARLYGGFGVRELWVIDAARMTTRVFRRPSPESYDEAINFVASDTIAPAFAPEAFSVRLDELKL